MKKILLLSCAIVLAIAQNANQSASPVNPVQQKLDQLCPKATYFVDTPQYLTDLLFFNQQLTNKITDSNNVLGAFICLGTPTTCSNNGAGGGNVDCSQFKICGATMSNVCDSTNNLCAQINNFCVQENQVDANCPGSMGCICSDPLSPIEKQNIICNCGPNVANPCNECSNWTGSSAQNINNDCLCGILPQCPLCTQYYKAQNAIVQYKYDFLKLIHDFFVKYPNIRNAIIGQNKAFGNYFESPFVPKNIKLVVNAKYSPTNTTERYDFLTDQNKKIDLGSLLDGSATGFLGVLVAAIGNEIKSQNVANNTVIQNETTKYDTCIKNNLAIMQGEQTTQNLDEQQYVLNLQKQIAQQQQVVQKISIATNVISQLSQALNVGFMGYMLAKSSFGGGKVAAEAAVQAASKATSGAEAAGQAASKATSGAEAAGQAASKLTSGAEKAALIGDNAMSVVQESEVLAQTNKITENLGAQISDGLTSGLQDAVQVTDNAAADAIGDVAAGLIKVGTSAGGDIADGVEGLETAAKLLGVAGDVV